jgi:hypothetical protein
MEKGRRTRGLSGVNDGSDVVDGGEHPQATLPSAPARSPGSAAARPIGGRYDVFSLDRVAGRHLPGGYAGDGPYSSHRAEHRRPGVRERRN